MEQNASWEANGSSASQKISRILWNQGARGHFHNSMPAVSVRSQVNLVQTSHNI